MRRVSIVILALWAVSLLGVAPLLRAMSSSGFIENRGQLDKRVKYYAVGSRMGIYFTEEGVIIDLKEDLRHLGARGPGFRFNKLGSWDGIDEPMQRRGCAVWIRFDGAIGTPQIEVRGEMPGHYNYYIGKDPDKWQVGVRAYKEIVCRDIWPGVEVIYRNNGTRLDYEVIERVEGALAKVCLAYGGVENVTNLGDGRYLIETSTGRLLDLRPDANSKIGSLSCEMDEDGTCVLGEEGLVWGTYLGGIGWDVAGDVAIDAYGNAVVTGWTYSDDFPTPGGYDDSYNSNGDAFVVKLSSAGDSLLWATYLGGSGLDRGLGIALDVSGNPVLTGHTNSSNFPTPGGYDQTYEMWGDAFVAKLSSPDGELVWGTYLGGSDDHACGYGIALDASNNPIVTGYTGSSDFPTPGGYDHSYNGGDDVFVAKLNGSGDTLLWGTYLGGNENEYGFVVALDAWGNPIVAGGTESLDFPTPGGYDQSLDSDSCAFVAKLSASGGTLLWATYLGGTGHDWGYGMALDTSGNPVVTGWTISSDFPTMGGYDQSLAGSDAFVAKLSGTGDTLLWGTYLGGSYGESGYVIAIDSSDNPVVAGWTFSLDFPAPGGDDELSGCCDVFVAKLRSADGKPVWGTYLGGSGDCDPYGVEVPNGMALDASGTAIVVGATESPDFPTPGGYDQTYNGYAAEAFVAKLSFAGGDITPPQITQTTDLDNTDDGAGPYMVNTRVTDDAGVATVNLRYRLNGGAFVDSSMYRIGDDWYRGRIPGQTIGTEICYYVYALDTSSNSATDPAGAPSSCYSFSITESGADDPPQVTGTTNLADTDDTEGPYVVSTTVSDDHGVSSVSLRYRLDGGGFIDSLMHHAGGDSFRGRLPGQQVGTNISYYVRAVDTGANTATDPPGAPGSCYGFTILDSGEEPDSLIVGGLVIHGDVIEQVTPDYYCVSGSVEINYFLKFDGILCVDISSLTLSGSGTLYTDALPSGWWGSGYYELYSGEFSVNVSNMLVNDFNSEMCEIDLGGFQVFMTELEFLVTEECGVGVRVGGFIGFPAGFGIVELDDLIICSKSGVYLVGRLEIADIVLDGGVEIRDAYFEFDTIDNVFCGGGYCRTPVLSVDGDVCVQEGCGISYFYVEIDLAGCGIPLGTTGLFLTGGALGMNHLCDPDPIGIQAYVDMNVGCAGTFDVVGFAGVGLDIQPPNYFEGRGGIIVFGRGLAYGLVRYSRDGVDVEGHLSILGFVEGDLEANLTETDFYGRVLARLFLTMNVFPDDYRWLGEMIDAFFGLPYQIGNAEVVVHNSRMKGLAVLHLFLTDVSFAFMIEYDNGLNLYVGSDYSRLSPVSRQFAAATSSALDYAESRSGMLYSRAPLQDETSTLIFVLQGSENAVDYNLISPSGTVVTPTESIISAGQYTAFARNDDARKSFYVVTNPESGEWQIEIPDPGSQIYTLDRYAKKIRPTIDLMEPGSERTTSKTIRWEAEDIDSDASISLFFDSDGDGFDGALITSGISEDAGGDTHVWQVPDSLPSGEYHIYGVIDDGETMPVSVYAPGTIQVTCMVAPGPPSNLQGAVMDTAVTLSWFPSTYGNIDGYVLHFTDEADGDYDRSLGVGDTTAIETSAIQPGRTYRIVVAAYDSTGLESAPSNEVQLVFESISWNNIPTITTDPVTVASLGGSYLYDVDAEDPDHDILTYSLVDTLSPIGMMMNASSGLMSWAVPDTALGTYRVKVEVTDGHGGEDSQEFLLTVLGTAESTGIISLNAAMYPDVAAFASITVTDPDLNVASGQVDSTTVRVTSATDGTGISVVCSETSTSSDIFQGGFGFSESGSDDGADVIGVSAGDAVTVSYDDAHPVGTRQAMARYAPADTVGPAFTIGLVQGSVLDDQLHIYAIPSEELVEPPTIKLYGNSLDVTTLQLGDVGLYYASDWLEATAVCSVEVWGRDLSGNGGYAYKTLSTGLLGEQPILVISADGQLALDWPGSESENTVVVVQYRETGLWGIESPSLDLLRASRSDVATVGSTCELPWPLRSATYSLSPEGRRLTTSAELRMSYLGDPGHIPSGMVPAIAEVSGASWHILDSRFDREVEQVIAEIENLGVFAVVLVDEGDLPDARDGESRLVYAHPNPFSHSTEIRYTVRTGDRGLNLKVFDVEGRLVRSLSSGSFAPGLYQVHWDGRDHKGEPAANGIYFITLTTETARGTVKVTLLR